MNKNSERSQEHHEHDLNWNNMADIFDRWLPYIQAVGEALIDLADISEGQRILDVAAGTGEPSLTLARRYQNQSIDIIAVDAARDMLKHARRKAEAAQLSNLHFQEMEAENLVFPDASFDRVISRFGLMLFDRPLRGLEEMRRVLKPRGKLAIAVWGAFHKLPTMSLIWDVLMKALPVSDRPEIPRISKLGQPDILERLFKTAGFERIDINAFAVSYRFDNFESYWSINTSGGLLKAPLDRFSLLEQQKIKTQVEALSTPYQEKNGDLVFQNEALLVYAEKV